MAILRERRTSYSPQVRCLNRFGGSRTPFHPSQLQALAAHFLPEHCFAKVENSSTPSFLSLTALTAREVRGQRSASITVSCNVPLLWDLPNSSASGCAHETPGGAAALGLGFILGAAPLLCRGLSSAPCSCAGSDLLGAEPKCCSTGRACLQACQQSAGSQQHPTEGYKHSCQLISNGIKQEKGH